MACVIVLQVCCLLDLVCTLCVGSLSYYSEPLYCLAVSFFSDTSTYCPVLVQLVVDTTERASLLLQKLPTAT